MAARNDVDEVKAIWEPPSASFDAIITTHLNIANRFVNGKIQGKECATGEAITEAELKDVELYVTAYFLSTRKPESSAGSVLSASTTKQGLYTFAGMMGNHYGQMAIELDCTGTLRALAATMAAAAQGKTNEAGQSSFLLTSDADLDLLAEEL